MQLASACKNVQTILSQRQTAMLTSSSRTSEALQTLQLSRTGSRAIHRSGEWPHASHGCL